MVASEINEIRALEIAINSGDGNRVSWMQPFWILRREDFWDIGAGSEAVVSVSAKSGQIVQPSNEDALRVFAAAKEYAASNRLAWKPMFTIEWCKGRWCVGSSQNQFGGQCHIDFDEALNVVGHRINPK